MYFLVYVITVDQQGKLVPSEDPIGMSRYLMGRIEEKRAAVREDFRDSFGPHQGVGLIEIGSVTKRQIDRWMQKKRITLGEAVRILREKKKLGTRIL